MANDILPTHSQLLFCSDKTRHKEIEAFLHCAFLRYNLDLYPTAEVLAQISFTSSMFDLVNYRLLLMKKEMEITIFPGMKCF